MDRPAEGLTAPEPPTGPDPDRRRPRDLALLLLAIGSHPPRARARDQQADRAGGALLRHVLDRLAALDPDPDSLDTALAAIVAEVGGPTGPTRGVCSQLRQEWDDLRAAPDAWGWLVAEALECTRRGDDTGPRRGRSCAAP